MAAAIEGKDGLLDKLVAFGRCVDSSTIYIVLAIDSTIAALQEVDQIARALALTCENISNDISTNAVLAGCLLDPTGRAIDGLSTGHQRINDLLPNLIAQSSAVATMGLSEQEQREFLIFAFERCIESFGWVVDAVMKVQQAIVAHDRSTEPKSDQGAHAEALLVDALESNAA